MIPLPIITHAVAAAVAASVAWTAQGWRANEALASLHNKHTQAQAALTALNAAHLVRVHDRGDALAVSLATQQTRINTLHQEHARAINRLTTGRACLSAELVSVLNSTQPATTDRPDALPTPTAEPAANHAATFASDADVSTWALTARAQYAECAARLGALVGWHVAPP
jgi:hypothetical protein